MRRSVWRAYKRLRSVLRMQWRLLSLTGGAGREPFGDKQIGRRERAVDNSLDI